MIEALPRHFETYDWITGVLLFLLMILAYARIAFSERFYVFQRIFLTDKFLMELRKSGGTYTRFDLILFVIHLGLIAMGLYFLILGCEFSEDRSYLLYIKIFVVYTVFILVKYLLEKILGSLLQLELLIDKYIYYKVNYKNLLSLFLLPVLLLLAYVWSGSVLFFKVITLMFLVFNMLALAFFYRKERAVISSNIFYFILYLCTFEIAPYYILYKIVT